MTLPILYSKPSCQQCKATARWLDKEGIEFEYRDASENPEYLEEVKALGYTQVPVTVANGEHWYGFNVEKLDEHFAKVDA